MNRHTIITNFKKIIFPKGELFEFNGVKLKFLAGSRPIRRKYINSNNDIVRNDVLQMLFFEKYFKKNDVLWDIGSHHGHYSIFAASVVNGDKQVFAFEPDADALYLQMKNIALNQFEKKITVCDFAISNVDGILQFMAEAGNSNSHLVKDISGTLGGNIVSVNARSINSLLDEFPEPTFVKIDTEGAEIDILKAATKLLENKKVKFICELHPFAWKAFNVQYQEFQDILKKYDRKITLLDTKKKISDLPFYGTVLF